MKLGSRRPEDTSHLRQYITERPHAHNLGAETEHNNNNTSQQSGGVSVTLKIYWPRKIEQKKREIISSQHQHMS